MFVTYLKYCFRKNYDFAFICKFDNLYVYVFLYKYWFVSYNFILLHINIKYYGNLILNFLFLYFLRYNIYNSLGIFFFNEIFVDGLYYRVKYYKSYNLLGFILGYNHYVLYKIPKNINVSVHMKKRRFFIYGFNHERISNIAHEIVNLKYPNLFKGKGLRIVNLKYRKKLIVKKTK
jgi:hypothetical protein